MKCKKQMILGIALLLVILFFATNSMANTAIVNTDTLKLRKEASTDSTVLELLNLGEKLEVIEQSGDWIKVKVNKMTGYVHKDYVKIEEDEATVTEPQNTNTQIETQTQEETQEPTIPQESLLMQEKIVQMNIDVFILPLINASKITTLNKDTRLIVMDEVNGWLYIQTDTISGWIRSTALLAQNEQQNEQQNKQQNTITVEETPIENKVMYVNYSSIYVRKGPSTEESIIDSLILNAQVNVIAETGDWYKVEVDGKTGYIAKRLLSSKKTEPTSRGAEEREEVKIEDIKQQETMTTAANYIAKGEEIVNYAKQYLGCPYVYGGSGPTNFDCSGFTMYVYQHFGISLSHSARAQANNGTYVEKANLQPGDLVFFKDYETMDGIGHCGIYIGEGNFIHASSGSGYCVKISTLLSGSYNTRYATARRVI